MKLLLKIVGALILVVVLLAVGAYAWASVSSTRLLTRATDAHNVDFPIPFPADDPDQALAEARARGKYLVDARYACSECHGGDFSGGVMIDAFPIGRLLGPNLTSGAGSVTTGYTPADWDRIVRHGIRRDGRPALMPSIDFQRMSDQELSDIVAYLQSVPPVDNVVPQPSLGPVGKWLVATGALPLSVDEIASHTVPHAAVPPPTTASVEFGRHVAGICSGCHREDFRGGPIPGGDPAWVPARNLTPHPDALGGWTLDQFVTAMRDGRRPDGSALQAPMPLMMPYAQRMADVELEALWLFLQSLPPLPSR